MSRQRRRVGEQEDWDSVVGVVIRGLREGRSIRGSRGQKAETVGSDFWGIEIWW